jgi:alkanesulfonate monooxygenase SsuD/methylene tetrahydromethanopterin reductase-like flavin-dependent oxidoreductase (luciferase family)
MIREGKAVRQLATGINGTHISSFSRLGHQCATSTSASIPRLIVSGGSLIEQGLIASRADAVRLAVTDFEQARQTRTTIRALAAGAGRNPDDVAVLVDLTVCLSSREKYAQARCAMLDQMTSSPLTGACWIGQPDGLVELICQWLDQGACDGFTFLPASLPVDLVRLAQGVIPELQKRGLARLARPVPEMETTAHTGVPTQPTARPRRGRVVARL